MRVGEEQNRRVESWRRKDDETEMREREDDRAEIRSRNEE